MYPHNLTTNSKASDYPVDFETIFNALPSACAVLSVSDYRIVAATDSFCAVIYRTRDELIGKALTKVLPESPSMHYMEATSSLLEAFEEVKRTKEFVSLGVVRYDVMRPDRKGDATEEHWWRISESPVLDERGEVVYIVHLAEEVTHVLEALEELEVAARRRAGAL